MSRIFRNSCLSELSFESRLLIIGLTNRLSRSRGIACPCMCRLELMRPYNEVLTMRAFRRYRLRLAVMWIMVVLGLSETAKAQVQFDNSVKSGFQWSVTQVTTPAFVIGTG